VEALEDRCLLTGVYTVTTTRDALNDANAGEVTLRDVLTAINTQRSSGNATFIPGGDLVDFHLPVNPGPLPTINLLSPLPAMTRPVFLDGWSQGHVIGGPPLVVLNGASAGAAANGLELDAGSNGSVVRGLVIGQFGRNGIDIHGASGVQLVGNYLGVGADGTSSFGNLNDGLLLDGGAAFNTIGAGNVISHNGNGLEIAGANTTGNLVVGNFIGTDSTGTVALGNTNVGILIDNGAHGNTIGGTWAGSANVVAGGFNVSVPNGGSSQAGAVFSLGAPIIVGNVASFDVEVSYSDSPPAEMVFLGIDVTASDSALEPINLATGLPDYSAFHFNPSSALGPAWTLIPNGFPGEFQYQTPPTTPGHPSAALRPNGTYFVGTLTYDLSKFGISPGSSLGVSIEGPETTAGTEAGGVPSTFDFLNPSFAPGQQPLVSGAGSVGVEVTGPGTSGNVIQGNLIGTNAGGTADLGHLSDDVLIQGGAAGNTVGGTALNAGNVIAGGDEGVIVSGTGTSGNAVLDNRIGTNTGGTTDLGNTLGGVLVENGATSDSVNMNTVAFNGEGVVVGNSPSDTATSHDLVLANSIYGNTGPGIDLGSRGGAGGTSQPANLPNDNQAAPAITALTLHSVSGALTSAPNSTFRIEIYASPVGGPPGQAQLLLGTLQVGTGAAGTAAFTLPVSSLPLGMVFTATATNVATGDTSAVSIAGTQLLILSVPVITSSSESQTVMLSAQLYSASKPLAGGQVTFSVPGLPGSVTGVANANGIVTAGFTLPANVAAGVYTVHASFAGQPGIPATMANDVLLTILSPPPSVARRWLR
jgi:titin